MREDQSSAAGQATPEDTYREFVAFCELGDIEKARGLTDGSFRIVSEEPIRETVPYINVRFFQLHPAEERIFEKELLPGGVALVRSGSAYFYMKKRKSKWVIVKAGLKPID